MVRNPRSKTTQRNIWAQLGVSACALLLPPMALGAAVYSMLPIREESAARPVAGTTAEAYAAASQPSTAATQPLAAVGKPAPTANTWTSVSQPSARQEPAGKTAAKDSGKDMARVLGPVPVRVTVVVPPAAVNPTADADGAPTGSIGAELARSAAVAPAATLPPLQAQPVQLPPRQLLPRDMPPREAPHIQMPVAQPPITEPQSADGPPESSNVSGARKHVRSFYLRNLARRNGAHAEARRETRSETHAARGNAQPQEAFSLRNWLHQLATRQRDTRS